MLQSVWEPECKQTTLLTIQHRRCCCCHRRRYRRCRCRRQTLVRFQALRQRFLLQLQQRRLRTKHHRSVVVRRRSNNCCCRMVHNTATANAAEQQTVQPHRRRRRRRQHRCRAGQPVLQSNDSGHNRRRRQHAGDQRRIDVRGRRRCWLCDRRTVEQRRPMLIASDELGRSGGRQQNVRQCWRHRLVGKRCRRQLHR